MRERMTRRKRRLTGKHLSDAVFISTHS
jgi:hypothetical protein